MLATFCLRLACGLMGCLPLLFPFPVTPRFYRVHFLVALGLTALAAVVGREGAGAGLWAALLAGMTCALLGSVSWSLEGAPGGRVLGVLTALALGAALGFSDLAPGTEAESEAGITGGPNPAWLVADDLTSAALLGTATTAMLLGHSYLISPALTITPLLRVLAALFAAVLLRSVFAGLALGFWTAGRSAANLEGGTVLWLGLRWGLGLVGPLVLGWMAREAARIRSTQSATGILYVAVIFCFLGELTSLVLLNSTGSVL